MGIKTVKVVHIYKTGVWVEDDMMGSRHVMLQHETCDPFTYCTFHYDYRYTSNSGTHAAARAMALSLGATEPIEYHLREMKFPTKDEIQQQIEALQKMLNNDDLGYSE